MKWARPAATGLRGGEVARALTTGSAKQGAIKRLLWPTPRASYGAKLVDGELVHHPAFQHDHGMEGGLLGQSVRVGFGLHGLQELGQLCPLLDSFLLLCSLPGRDPSCNPLLGLHRLNLQCDLFLDLPKNGGHNGGGLGHLTCGCGAC
jgi:hypothetical protein